jgi:hypothetical protein
LIRGETSGDDRSGQVRSRQVHCAVCDEPISPDERGVHESVNAYEGDGVTVVVERLGEFAHGACIERLVALEGRGLER